MATSSGLFLATIYNQSQLAERKHMARYLLINTAATAVPLSAQYNEISGGHIGRGGCLEEVFCRPSTAPVVQS